MLGLPVEQAATACCLIRAYPIQTSGGAYKIATPNPSADARLLTERHRTTFVNYLRICLRGAGFPKLEPVTHAPSEFPGMTASQTRSDPLRSTRDDR